MRVGVRLAAAVLATGLLSTGAAAAPAPGQLTVRIAPAHPVLGHPLRLTLRAVGAPTPLAQLSLAPLRVMFSVQDVFTTHDEAKRGTRRVGVDTMTVTLYPRQAGRLPIPSLHLGTWSSRPQFVDVAPTGPPGSVILVRSGAERDTSWVRQETLVFIDIYDDAQGVLAEVPGWRPEGAFARPLAMRTRRVREHGVTYNVTRLAWAVMPLRPGSLRLAFPMLHVRSRARFGKRLRYPVAPVSLRVRPLPSYIPADVPVGQVHVKSTLPVGRLWPGRPYTWHVRVQGTGIDLNGLRTLLGAQLHGPPGLRLYHPLYERIDDDEGGALAQTFRVSIPFVADSSGVDRLPQLTLPFVDGRTGRLANVRLGGTPLRVSSPLRVALGWGLGVVVVLTALLGLGRWVRSVWRRGAARRAALRGVRRADGPGDLAQALLAWPVRGTVPVRTLEQWRRAQRVRDPALAQELAEVLARLQRARYGPPSSAEALPGLKARVLGLVQRL